MLNSYIATGYYVNECSNGLQNPITGSGIFTSYLDACDAEGKAYQLAIVDANRLRLITPCLSSGSTTTTTTTTTTTPAPNVLPPSGIQFYDWTGYWNGEVGNYYDIVAWGSTNGYLSGISTFENNQYFTQISASDLNGAGTVLAVMKNGSVTGFGDNSKGLLNIPTLSDAIQVSVGYDHCLVLRSTSGLVTGWGNDQWGSLSILPRISGARKVCAGIGSSYFLLNSGGGRLTGDGKIYGTPTISLPAISGIVDIDHYNYNVIFVHSGGYISGCGFAPFGESAYRPFNGISKISAGTFKNVLVYNEGYTTGYGQAQVGSTPNLSSGIDIQFKGNMGTALNKDQSLYQWSNPYVAPSYITNNVVAISQAENFTAVIIKRPCSTVDAQTTGYGYLWKVTGVSNFNGGIEVNDLYPSLGTVTQPCDCYSFSLPQINNVTGQQYTQSVTSCNPYAGYHNIYFISVKPQFPLLNIDYALSSSAQKTGFAATGITTGDRWNKITSSLRSFSGLYYSDGNLSNVSGGFITLGTGNGITFTNNDTMFGSAISGISGEMIIRFSGMQSGDYNILVYGQGPKLGNVSYVSLYKDSYLVGYSSTLDNTTSGVINNFLNLDGLPFPASSMTYTTFNVGLDGTDILLFVISGYINGIQFANIS